MAGAELLKVLIFDASQGRNLSYAPMAEDAASVAHYEAITYRIQGQAREALKNEPFAALIAAPGDEAIGNYDGKSLLREAAGLVIPRVVLSGKKYNEFVRTDDDSPDILLERKMLSRQQITDRLSIWLLERAGVEIPKE